MLFKLKVLIINKIQFRNRKYLLTQSKINFHYFKKFLKEAIGKKMNRSNLKIVILIFLTMNKKKRITLIQNILMQKYFLKTLVISYSF